MKTKTILISSLLLLMTLLVVSILVIQTTAIVIADVRITPFMLTEEDGAPTEFRVTVKLPKSSGYTPEDIDPESVAVEGFPMMPVEDWPKVTKSFFAFKVNGNDLFEHIKSKIGHVTPGNKTTVDVTVTGNFYEGDGFIGTCTMTMMLERTDPEPPPG